MRQYTLIAADSSEDFRQAIKLQFEPYCQVFCCSRGSQVLDLMGKVRPDAILLDLMLPGMDGLSLLHAMEALGDLPGILAVSSYVSPYLLEACQRLGVRYLMEKPCSLLKAEELLRRLLESGSSQSSEDRFMKVSGLLLRLGFSVKLRGYTYLRDAVLRFSQDPGQSVIKELYPAVAGVYGVTAEDVEHSIRSAAADAWSHRSREVWTRCFPGERNKPSNAALIQTLSEKVREASEVPVSGIL